MSFNNHPLLLASTSSARKTILTSAGLHFVVKKPDIDEVAFHQKFKDAPAPEMAQELAARKALSLSNTTDNTLVIGADQILEFEGQIIHKASTLSEAQQNLRKFSGKTHKLHSAVCVAHNHRLRFNHISTATLYMRSLGEDFLQNYFHSAQDALLHSVGGYHIEGLGIQLFDKIDGDIHSIMGMPLIPLLAFLRQEGIIQR